MHLTSGGILSAVGLEGTILRAYQVPLSLNFSEKLFQVQNNKQSISTAKSKIAEKIDDYKVIADGNVRISPQWSNEELLLAVQGTIFD